MGKGHETRTVPAPPPSHPASRRRRSSPCQSSATDVGSPPAPGRTTLQAHAAPSPSKSTFQRQHALPNPTSSATHNPRAKSPKATYRRQQDSAPASHPSPSSSLPPKSSLETTAPPAPVPAPRRPPPDSPRPATRPGRGSSPPNLHGVARRVRREERMFQRQLSWTLSHWECRRRGWRLRRIWGVEGAWRPLSSVSLL